MLGHLRHSETAFPSAAFWWKETKTSHRGLSQVNMVGVWPAEHHWRLESPELQLLCVCWRCHDGTVDTRSGKPFTPLLEDLRQTVVDIPVSRNRLFVLKQYGGNVAECYKETCYHLFWSTSVSFEFHRWVLIWEDPQRQLLLHLRVILVYPGFVSCYNVPNARRPSSVQFS